jgi:flagellar protein FlgJ
MSGDKLGLADMIFRSIQAKQHAQVADDQGTQAPVPSTPQPEAAPQTAQTSAGYPLAPYWQGNGLRPLAATRTTPNPGRAGAVAGNTELSPTSGWTASPAIVNAGAYASGAVPSEQVQSFTRQLGPLLQEAGRQLGVSPRILLAQAALETGWGRSVVGNNVFGIKASQSWRGSEVTTTTHEVEAGQMVPRQASFRSYPSLDAAVQDYVALIGNSPRYQSVIGVGDNAAAYARGLLAGGYATDTEYAHKLEAVAASQSAAAAIDAPSHPARLRLFATQG